MADGRTTSKRVPGTAGTKLYLRGVAAIGALTGLDVGLSKTPVVGEFLPLLLGLLAAGGGAAAMLWSPSDRRRGLIGGFFMVFAGSCFAGTLLGGIERGLSSGCLNVFGLVACEGRPDLTPQGALATAADIVEIRSYLKTFGATAAEIAAIEDKLRSSGVDERMTDDLKKNVNGLKDAYTKLGATGNAAASSEVAKTSAAAFLAENDLKEELTKSLLADDSPYRNDAAKVRALKIIIDRARVEPGAFLGRDIAFSAALASALSLEADIKRELDVYPEFYMEDLQDRLAIAKQSWLNGVAPSGASMETLFLENRSQGE